MKSAGQPAFNIARTVRSPARAGSVSGRVVGSRGPSVRTGSVEPAGGFCTARALQRGKVCPVSPWRVKRGIERQEDINRRYTHTVHRRRDATRTEREVTRCLRADMRGVKTRVLEALPVSLSVAKAS